MEYIPKDTIALAFIKKEPMTGSYEGMRYKLSKKGEAIEVCIWPEPYNFHTTKEELKQYKEFELSPEGKDDAVDWLNEQIDVQAGLWENARNAHWA